MRKVILQEFLSVDSFAAGPKDSTEFVPAATRGDKSFQKEQDKLVDSVDAILLGRVTYEMFAKYFPNVTK